MERRGSHALVVHERTLSSPEANAGGDTDGEDRRRVMNRLVRALLLLLRDRDLNARKPSAQSLASGCGSAQDVARNLERDGRQWWQGLWWNLGRNPRRQSEHRTRKLDGDGSGWRNRGRRHLGSPQGPGEGRQEVMPTIAVAIVAGALRNREITSTSVQFHGLRGGALADLDLVRSSTQRRGEPALANKRSTFPERIFSRSSAVRSGRGARSWFFGLTGYLPITPDIVALSTRSCWDDAKGIIDNLTNLTQYR